MKLRNKVMASILCFTVSAFAVEAPASATTGLSDPLTAEESAVTERELEELLGAIDSIPEEVLLEGDEATAAWVQANLATPTITPYWATQAACVGSIIWMLGSTVFPVAKIMKVRKYIKELGGVRAAVQQLREHNFNWESIEKAGGSLRALGAEIIGVAGVGEYCFN